MRHKNEIPITLTLDGQDAFKAIIFLKIDERIIDLLNDGRDFIPVRKDSGEMLFLAKNSIVSLLEDEKETKQKYEEKYDEKVETEEVRKSSFDPYKVLRVNQDASNEEIRRAYKERIKAVHPDTIAALDLDEDLSRAALLAAQKVNYAYKIIMQQRDNEPLKSTYV